MKQHFELFVQNTLLTLLNLYVHVNVLNIRQYYLYSHEKTKMDLDYDGSGLT